MSIITKTKTFFKSKPIRIIIALCVIAAIMVAIGIGISALVKNLTDKCANQPGTDWDSALNMCVPRGCDDGGPVCKSKNASDDKSGKCIPADYCSTSEPGNYEFDPDSCECIRTDCGTDNVPINPNDDKSYVIPPITSGNQLICGQYCEEAKKLCLPNEICGYKQYPGEEKVWGCYDTQFYSHCEGSPSNLVCYKGKCTSDNEFCQPASLCEDVGGYVLCRNNDDCASGSSCINNSTFTNKNFQNIKGKCQKSNVKADDSKCIIDVSLDEIGENSSGLPINCSGKLGVSNQISQCKNLIYEGKIIDESYFSNSNMYNDADNLYACANKVCEKESSKGLGYYNDDTICNHYSVSKCDTSDMPCYIEGCCPYLINDGPKKSECCAKSTTDNKNCYFRTQNPIDAFYIYSHIELNTPLTDTIIKDNNGNEKEVTDKLKKIAGVDTSNNDITIYSNSEGSYFENCGFNLVNANTYEFDKNSGICYKKDTSCKESTAAGSDWTYNTFTPLGTPICKSRSTDKQYWAGYDIENNKEFSDIEFKTSQTLTFNNCKHVPIDMINNIAKQTSGASGFSYSMDESRNVHATIDYKCNNMNVTLNNGNTVSWMELNKTHNKSLNEDVYNAIKESEYMFAAPYSMDSCKEQTKAGPYGNQYYNSDITKYFIESEKGGGACKTTVRCNKDEGNACGYINPSAELCNPHRYWVDTYGNCYDG